MDSALARGWRSAHARDDQPRGAGLWAWLEIVGFSLIQ